jgi:hypothetical protein
VKQARDVEVELSVVAAASAAGETRFLGDLQDTLAEILEVLARYAVTACGGEDSGRVLEGVAVPEFLDRQSGVAPVHVHRGGIEQTGVENAAAHASANRLVAF